MKRGRGIKDRDDKSMGMEILMAEVFTKINPTDPLNINYTNSAKKPKVTGFLWYFVS